MFKTRKIIREKSRQKIMIGEKEIPYTLIRSNRARRVSLRVGERTGLEVVVPLRGSLSQVPRFMREKEVWILRHLREIEKKKANKPQLRDGAQVHILGEPRTIRLHPAPPCRPSQRGAPLRRRPHVKEARMLKFSSDAAYYDGTEILIYASSLTDARQALEKHLRAQAKKQFSRRTAEVAARMGVTYNRITVKGQKSRWGSCSREKNLNFNWRLIFASPEIVDSIIFHELTHTVHLNHGKRFYALLEKHCPNHRELSRQLKNMSFII